MKSYQWKILGVLALYLVVAAIAGCGQIITNPTPTPQATPTEAVTPTATAPATPTALPLTPLPTETATITPTPVFYAVQKGDNLLSIAKSFGVSVEAVQDANGILDPRRLQVGQELLIPVDDSVLATPQAPTPTPMPYDILGLSFQMSPSGRLWCLGEIENTAGTDLEQVEVGVSLFDDAGQMLAYGSAFTEREVVPQGQRAPFVVAFDDPPEKFATYQSLPLRGIPINHPGRYTRELEITETRGEPRGGSSYSVSGRVRNTGDTPIQSLRLVITGYTSEGQVAAVRKVAPETDALSPGKATDFEINLLSTAGTVVTYTLAAEGLEEASTP